MLDKTIAMLMTVGLLSACTAPAVTIDENFGAAVRHNIAVQTINPDAGGQDASDSIDGRRAQQAIESYRQPPEPTGSAQQSLIIGIDDQ